MKPTIIAPYDAGLQNADIKKTNERLSATGTYKNNSTVIITPTRGGRALIPRCVSAAQQLIRPMNTAVVGPIYTEYMEVGEAFNSVIEMILAHPQLNKFKYILTLEDDNAPPPDGLQRLHENIEDYSVLAGLYFTKGECGQPMIYGNPNESPLNFLPQLVQPDCIQRCNGTGMGFALMKLSLFKKMEKPWFKTFQENGKLMTQDLFFYEKVIRAGGKIAVDTRVKVGHFDPDTGTMW